MFIPTTPDEMEQLGWKALDVILISGDTYIDSPYQGVSIIGHVLMEKGYKVGIIAQPDIQNPGDIKRLGKPGLFWGITSGSVDSMISNYTANKKLRNVDDLTPGETNNRRPDRALIAYTNLIQQTFKNNPPIILGGIDASLRRVAHYDYWTNKIRRSILLDTKADYLIYGMGENTILSVAQALEHNSSLRDIRGLCYVCKTKKEDYLELPSYEECAGDPASFQKMFMDFYQNNDALTARGLQQQYNDRYLVINPPALPLTSAELDHVYSLPYEQDAHPYYKAQGKIRALDTILFSITSHRGCYGECNFCAIALHQGRTVVSRSEESILKEAESFTSKPNFKGIIFDVGGPTANMYGFECAQKVQQGACRNKRCLYPGLCSQMKVDHRKQIALLKKLRLIKGIKKIFIGSGVRYDLVMEDRDYGEEYLKELVAQHISGQMKIAPEHTEPRVLEQMGKPGPQSLTRFKELFTRLNDAAHKNQFLTYYFIAAHPGCSMNEMQQLRKYISKNLQIRPEQVQIFTPGPSTISTLIYYTGIDPYTNKKVFVEKDLSKKIQQKNILKK